ncbi:SH3 domain-containing protein [Paenibacillus pasadenensis]|uniref:C40 family peptidase n=1 Tax=Paenibacillus pasadenensis TaxID=217090 RepID=UPI00203C5355|nr:SH3 domain-containing protein [Paenibacillus pasadenensis]MCM3749175.1 SH3 domain-containing protein [Paenibacillus pasadenensis]
MRKPIAAVLAAGMLLTAAPLPYASAASQSAVTQSSVNLRDEPSTKGKVLRLLAKGENLSVISRVNNSWIKVKESGGKVGYVSSSSQYISLKSDKVTASKPLIQANAEIAATVSFRASASASSERLRYLKKGENVQILSSPTPYWYRIKDEKGSTGYISSDTKYVTLTSDVPGRTSPEPSITPTPSKTPAPTATPSKTPAPTATPSKTPAPTATPSKTPAPTATPSKTPAPTATPSKTPVPTATPSKTPAPTATPRKTPAPTATPSKTPAPTATPSKTPVPTATPSKTPAPTPDAGSTEFIPNAEVAASVALRRGPSTSHERIRYLKVGEEVQIEAVANRSWYQVRDGSGVSGYVSSDTKYITVTGELPGGNSPTPSPTPSAMPAPAPGNGPEEDGSSSLDIESVIQAGLKYLGTPYEFGSSRNDTATFDCSDFVRQAFIDALGIKLPADSRGQGQFVKNKGVYKMEWDSLERGDLMFFTTYAISKEITSDELLDTSLISHVGIYLGDNKILQTFSKESGGVQVTEIPSNSSWKTRFMFGGSALQ